MKVPQALTLKIHVAFKNYILETIRRHELALSRQVKGESEAG